MIFQRDKNNGERREYHMKAALVYTSTTPELIELVEREVNAQIGEDLDIISLENPDILAQIREAGYVTSKAAADLISMYMEAVRQGADAILNVCSSVGEVADSVQIAADYIGVPIVRIDEEMCREAVRRGKRIAVLATLFTTLTPTKNTILRVAKELDRNVELIDGLIDGAFGLNQEEFRRLLIGKAMEVKERADVILLAQGSMAYVEQDIMREVGILTLSSPRFGAIELRKALEKKGLVKQPLSIMDNYHRVDEKAVHERFQKEWEEFKHKVVVLDDDPTGVQTVHDVNVYTDWKEESLIEGLWEDGQIFYILTNSRSFTTEQTSMEHRKLAVSLVRAARQTGKQVLLVSRGDSTLRGHYLLELAVLEEALRQETGRKIDGQILLPFFKEGGRFTIDSVHYVKEGEWLVPVGQTEFAKDKTFGYRSSHLGEYVQEKSDGRYHRENCIYITLSMLREEKYEKITNLLMDAKDFIPICVDAISESDVEIFGICLLRAIKAGKEFLIRSAAALPKVLGNIENRPLLTREELIGEGQEAYGGIVLIGSHVKKTSLQLEELRKMQCPAEFIEFDVASCFADGGLAAETERIIKKAEEAMAACRTAVVYTSRQLLAPEGMTGDELLKLSVDISDALTGIIAGLERRPRFVIAKGGITSSDVGTKALRVHKAKVIGQVQPGVPVWQIGKESKFPGLSYIIFPGNVGEEDTLRKIVEMLC